MRCKAFSKRINGLVRMQLCFLLFMLPQLLFAQYFLPPYPHVKYEPVSDQGVTGLLNWASFYYNKPEVSIRSIDMGIRYARKAHAEALRNKNKQGEMQANLLLGYLFVDKRQLDSAENILPRLDDTSKMKMLLRLSVACDNQPGDDFEALHAKGIELAQKIFAINERIKDIQMGIMAAQIIACIRLEDGKKEALDEMEDVIKKIKASGNPRFHSAYFPMEEYYTASDTPAKALFYIHSAVVNAELTKDSSMLGDLYIEHAAVSVNNDEYENALNYAMKAVEVFKRYKGQFFYVGHPYISIQVTRIYNKMHRPADARKFAIDYFHKYPPMFAVDTLSMLTDLGHGFRAAKMFDKAEKYLLDAYALGQKRKLWLLGINKNLGQLYVEMHEYNKARPYLIRALQQPQLQISGRRYTHFLLFLADSSTGRYKDALTDLAFMKEIDTVNQRINLNRDAAKLKLLYETEKKENEIKFKDERIRLLNGEAKSQQIRLKQANFIKSLTIFAIALLLVVLTLVYYQYRQKQKMASIVTGKNNVITGKNELLEQLLKEKEILLKEVHHRVKNNLHTVICLLESQAGNLQGDALKAIKDSERRIYAMSLIHQKLYQSDNIQSIDMRVYLDEFLNYLKESFSESRPISYNFQIEPIVLHVTQAIPIALIINEAVTNSIKYAFVNRNCGTVSVNFFQQQNELHLIIKDDGVGIQFQADKKVIKTLGLELIDGLSEDLEGKLTITNDHGTTIRLIFPRETILTLSEKLSESIPQNRTEHFSNNT